MNVGINIPLLDEGAILVDTSPQHSAVIMAIDSCKSAYVEPGKDDELRESSSDESHIDAPSIAPMPKTLLTTRHLPTCRKLEQTGKCCDGKHEPSG